VNSIRGGPDHTKETQSVITLAVVILIILVLTVGAALSYVCILSVRGYREAQVLLAFLAFIALLIASGWAVSVLIS
jgi:hypothetical protein